MSASLTVSAPAMTALAAREVGAYPPFAARAFLRSLVESTIIHPDDWLALPEAAQALLASAGNRDALLDQLVELNLLNEYQSARVSAGTIRGMVLGNYRVLGRIGAGGLGIVFEAEHVQLRRKVAIKVLPLNPSEQPNLVARFFREIRAVAELDHPNIVAAIDAGISPGQAADDPNLHYFVMEHLTGKDLEQKVADGPLSIPDACGLIYQAASALDAAHQHQLVHRDIKPSNLFVTHEGNAKLLDFGLVRQTRGEALTASVDLIGTLDYMAPEQARDATSIDIRADIFSLGATLFFALVGQSPFPLEGSVHEILRRRQSQQPLRAIPLRHDVPESLEAVLGRMMALNVSDRFATPQEVMHALLPFVAESCESVQRVMGVEASRATQTLISPAPRRACVLVVEHETVVRKDLTRPITAGGFDCLEANDKDQALQLVRGGFVQLVLLGLDAPQTGGLDLLKLLRANPPCPNLKIVVSSTQKSDEELSTYLSQGADDCLSLPLSDVQLVARTKAAISHKAAEDHMDQLNQQMLELNSELERSLTARTSDLTQSRNSLVLALARLVEYRSTETLAHLYRVQRYCTLLAQEAAANPRLAGQIDQGFIQTLECVAPLHDIGNVGLPDSILLKAGPFEPEEQRRMQAHTTIGADTLQQVAHQFGAGTEFLQMAIDVARHHHEHFDGSGYPCGLAGDAIPLAARILAIADAYDSLRSRRVQRPRLSHASAVQIILEASPGKYDPALLDAFKRCTPQLERIYREVQDNISME